MKVTCPGCAKVYDLPREQIKPEGTKVKCKDCGKLFLVRPKAGAPKDHDDTPSTPVSPPPAPAAPAAPPVDDNLEDFFGAAAGGAPQAPADDDLDNFFDEPPPPLDAGTPAADPFASGDDDLFGGGDDLFGDPAPSAAPAAGAGGDTGGDDLFGDSTDLFGDPEPSDPGTAAQSHKEALDSLFDDSAAEEPPPAAPAAAKPAPEAAPPKPDFDWDDEPETKDVGKPTDLAADGFAPAIKAQDAEKVLRKTVVQEAPAHAPKRRGGLVVALLVLLIAGGGAGVVVLRPDLIDMLLGSTVAPSPTSGPAAPAKPVARPVEPRIPVVGVATPQVFREQNRRGVTLLVVQGELRNDDKVPHSFVRIRVDVLDPAGQPVTSSTVYAGNSLTSLQLRTFSPNELSERLQVEVGDQLRNFNIAPGATVPYTAIFAPDPTSGETLPKAAVRTVKSQRGEQN